MVDEVVGRGYSEVLFRVVDDLVGSEGLYEFQIRGAAHSGDLRSEGLRQLDGRGAERPGGTVDEHLLPRADAPSPEKIQRTGRSPRDRGGFLEGHVRRLEGAGALFSQAGVLGIRPDTEPEDLVPRFESAHLFADGRHFSGEVRSEDALPRSEEPEDEPNEEWVRLSLTDVPRGHGCREHAD